MPQIKSESPSLIDIAQANSSQIMPLNQLKAISKAMNDLSAVEIQVKDLKSALERTS